MTFLTKKRIEFFRKHALLILIVLLGFSLRVVALDKVPPAMTHDELGYVYNAYSIAKTGEDVNGVQSSDSLV